MVTPVFITQIEDEEHSVLSEQIHSLNLKDTTSMSTKAFNTYIPQGKAPSTVTARTKKKGNDVFPSPLYLPTSIGATTETWEPVPTDTTSMSSMALDPYHPPELSFTSVMGTNQTTYDEDYPQPVFSNTSIGATIASRESSTSCMNPDYHIKLLNINIYQAKQYYETTCNKNPKFLLAMAHGIINPKTGFPLLTPDGEPFCSFHKKNEYKVGNTHFISEITRRAKLDPNWAGVRLGNTSLPQPKSWNRSKCLLWLSNNPILNVEDRCYIVDSMIELIQSVSSCNKEHVKFVSKRLPKNNPNADTPLSNDFCLNEIHPSDSTLQSTSVLDMSSPLQVNKAYYGRTQVKVVPKGTGKMDPGTFKLVIEHQKEYSLSLPDCTQNKVRLGQKKLWDSLWPKLKAESRKKKRSVKYVWKKKELAAEKARVDYLDKVHDLNTPMF